MSQILPPGGRTYGVSWECRRVGGLEYWSTGVLEYWSTGVLEYWSSGVLEGWWVGVWVHRGGPYREISNALEPFAEHLRAKTIVGVTNPITADRRALTIGHNNSGRKKSHGIFRWRTS
jgi:hypothetical protein